MRSPARKEGMAQVVGIFGRGFPYFPRIFNAVGVGRPVFFPRFQIQRRHGVLPVAGGIPRKHKQANGRREMHGMRIVDRQPYLHQIGGRNLGVVVKPSLYKDYGLWLSGRRASFLMRVFTGERLSGSFSISTA